MIPPPEAVVRLVVPELVVLEVAVNELISAAFNIAPALTTKISLPVPKSVMLSVPESTLKVSSPALPVRLSLPAPPVIISFPPFPVIISAPLPPFSVSTAAPPVIVKASLILNGLQVISPASATCWTLKGSTS